MRVRASARARLKSAGEREGVRITYLPFIAKAVMLSLRAFPKMNASMDDAAGEIDSSYQRTATKIYIE